MKIELDKECIELFEKILLKRSERAQEYMSCADMFEYVLKGDIDCLRQFDY